MNSNFAENIKRIRKENNLSQEQLADKLGVSRQSVSKWESGTAYPEMDKVLQLCKMFNLNVDELLNQNIKEIREVKESKNKINKYIDDFLSFITKTVDMFSSMSFKSKLKCLFEQFVIIMVLLILCLIVGAICGSIISSLLRFLPYKVYNVIFGILEAMYFVIYLVFALVVFVHIFKTRYLDYYEIVKEEHIENNITDDETNNVVSDNNNKILLEKKKEKIIIRDPNHSEYRFINGLLKCLLFMIKCFALFMFFCFSFALLGFIFAMFTSIYHIFTHSLFLGLAIIMLACSVVCVLILMGLYSFIFNKKFYDKKVFVIFIVSLLISGFGVTLTFINCLGLEYLEINYENSNEISKTFNYSNNIEIHDYYDNYIFEVNNDLNDKILIKVNYNENIYRVKIEKDKNYISTTYNYIFDNPLNIYKQLTKSLKENKIYDYNITLPEMTIVTSENNIKEIINQKTSKAISKLNIEDGKYYLKIYSSYDDSNRLCYNEYGYYNNCVSIEGSSDIEINDFIYDSNGLHYDTNKYYCFKQGSSQYYCRLNFAE